jgi:hypothetical protein
MPVPFVYAVVGGCYVFGANVTEKVSLLYHTPPQTRMDATLLYVTMLHEV